MSWVALSMIDDVALLLLAAKNLPRATFSDLVVPLNSSGESIMAAKNTTVVSAASEEEKLANIIAALKASRGTKKPGNLVDRMADAAADAGRSISRIGAGFAAATENAALSFEAERERQTMRTAQHLLSLARS
jgi:hypothetical protein